MKKNSALLFMINGFGLSSNWQSNAIAMAKTENFESLWQNFRHAILLTKQDDINLEENHFNNYSCFATGNKPLSVLPTVALTERLYLNRARATKSSEKIPSTFQ